MIPKIIHCFWAGGPKTELAEKCLASWRKYAPGWEIVEWNLEDLGVGDSCSGTKDEIPSFVWKAIALRKWAFVADWARFAVLQQEGGVYFDYDFELVKPIEELPEGKWCAGQWLPDGRVGMEPAAIALEKVSPLAQAMLDYYATAEFNDKVTVGEIMEGLRDRGLGIRVLEPEVMSPIGVDGKLHHTERTVGIHWYAMSWVGPVRRFTRWLSWHGMRPLIDALLALRNRVRKVLS